MASYRAGDFEAAIQNFRQVVSLAPDQLVALELLNDSQDALLELMVAGGEFESLLVEDVDGVRVVVLVHHDLDRASGLAFGRRAKRHRVAIHCAMIVVVTTGVGKDIVFTVTWDEACIGTSSSLTLSNGASATYTSGSGTATVVFTYTVAESASHSDSDVTVTALAGTLADAAGGQCATFTHDPGTINVDSDAPDYSSMSVSADTYIIGENVDSGPAPEQMKRELAEPKPADKHGWSIRLPIYANATPSGRVTKDMHDHFTQVVIDSLKADGPFDGIYLSLHGAMACEHDEDGEGRLLQSVRDLVGPDMPIAVTLDLHANTTDRMGDLSDILISYRTYPHIDQYEVATQACDLLDRTMKGEIHPKVHVRRREMLDGADHGRTTGPGPMVDALKTLDKLIAETPGVYAGSINAGFPWVDIHDVGPTCVVTGEGDDPAHAKIAETVMEQIWQDRNKLSIELVKIPEAIKRVQTSLAQGVSAPIVLAERVTDLVGYLALMVIGSLVAMRSARKPRSTGRLFRRALTGLLMYNRGKALYRASRGRNR